MPMMDGNVKEIEGIIEDYLVMPLIKRGGEDSPSASVVDINALSTSCTESLTPSLSSSLGAASLASVSAKASSTTTLASEDADYSKNQTIVNRLQQKLEKDFGVYAHQVLSEADINTILNSGYGYLGTYREIENRAIIAASEAKTEASINKKDMLLASHGKSFEDPNQADEFYKIFSNTKAQADYWSARLEEAQAQLEEAQTKLDIVMDTTCRNSTNSKKINETRRALIMAQDEREKILQLMEGASEGH